MLVCILALSVLSGNTATNVNLCNKDTGSAHTLDLLLGNAAEELGLDNDWLLREMSLAQNLVDSLQNTQTKQMKDRVSKY